MRRFVIGLAVVAATVAAQSATAATLTWNTCGDGPGSPGTCSFAVTESARTSSGTDPANTYTFAAVGQANTTDDPTKNADVRAYRTTGTNSIVGLGTVTRSRINVFNGGLGIDGLDSSDETNPQHAIDNVGADEFIVFRLPSNGMVNVSFKIGYLSGDADITMWLGGQLGTAAQGDAFALLGTSGFQWNQGQTLVNTYGYKTQTFLDVPTNTSRTMTIAGAAGRYLIIGAQHECTGSPCYSEHGEDHFKLMSVVANTPASPPSSVPYPGSIAMVGAGFIAVAAIRRIRR